MSDKYTVAQTTHMCVGERGHVAPEIAIEQLRQYAEHQLHEAQQTLQAIDEGHVNVYHQTGIYSVHDRRQIA